ncbi:hypothetical protein NON27_30500 [Vibrio parahaemolyticus]|nr:hypothetical protein [Vibrio parahaemolyticus]
MCRLSTKVIVYKGLCMTDDLHLF